jgi:hypothetical protein
MIPFEEWLATTLVAEAKSDLPMYAIFLYSIFFPLNVSPLVTQLSREE